MCVQVLFILAYTQVAQLLQNLLLFNTSFSRNLLLGQLFKVKTLPLFGNLPP